MLPESSHRTRAHVGQSVVTCAVKWLLSSSACTRALTTHCCRNSWCCAVGRTTAPAPPATTPDAYDGRRTGRSRHNESSRQRGRARGPHGQAQARRDQRHERRVRPRHAKMASTAPCVWCSTRVQGRAGVCGRSAETPRRDKGLRSCAFSFCSCQHSHCHRQWNQTTIALSDGASWERVQSRRT